MSTAFRRTPEDNFADLSDFDFPPNAQLSPPAGSSEQGRRSAS